MTTEAYLLQKYSHFGDNSLLFGMSDVADETLCTQKNCSLAYKKIFGTTPKKFFNKPEFISIVLHLLKEISPPVKQQ